jgi:hypothetical protein
MAVRLKASTWRSALSATGNMPPHERTAASDGRNAGDLLFDMDRT